MPQGTRLKPTNIIYSVAEFIRLRDQRLNTPARLLNGVWSYWVGHEWVSQARFDQLHPKIELGAFNWKGEAIGKYANL